MLFIFNKLTIYITTTMMTLQVNQYMVEHVLEVTSPLSASIAPQRQVGATIVILLSIIIVINTIVIFVINFTTTISLSILPSSSSPSSRWHQVTDSGRTAMFNCSVSGFPVLNVYW